MDRDKLLGLGLVCLTIVCVAACAYLQFWALFVLPGAAIMADRLFDTPKDEKKDEKNG